jgi:hypothetical protein
MTMMMAPLDPRACALGLESFRPLLSYCTAPTSRLHRIFIRLIFNAFMPSEKFRLDAVRGGMIEFH